MYSAQIAGFTLEPDYIDGANADKLYAEEIAKEIAVVTRGWDPRDVLADEDAASSPEVLVKLRVRPIAGLRAMRSNGSAAVPAALADKGVHLSMAL